jgi:hypothetical protein
MFLQMACEKLVKAYRCGEGADPSSLFSHAVLKSKLPAVLRQVAVKRGFSGRTARSVFNFVNQMASEIEILSPSVNREEKRPDNCEYPWEDQVGKLRVPMDWSFHITQLLIDPKGHSFLKLVRGAFDDQLPQNSTE